MRLLRLAGLVVFIVAIAQVTKADETPSAVCDLSSLNLEVESAQVVESIPSHTGTLTAPEGKKIVVVHLKAGSHAPMGCAWLSDLDDFEAVYVYKDPAKPNEMPYHIRPADGILFEYLASGEELWFFQGQMGAQELSRGRDILVGGGIMRLQDVESIDVAFIVPKDLMAFTVRIPASVKGGVTLAPAK